MRDNWISNTDWQTIVANVPIVSVDLLVRSKGRVLFGKRRNKPAQGCWFVPGGRVHKNELRTEAVDRIAGDELGIEVEIVESVGTYEHFYETADVPDAGGKHYLATGYVVDCVGTQLTLDEQHEELRFFEAPPEPVHEYVSKYLQDAESLLNWT